jgi:MoxR-like ATPase
VSDFWVFRYVWDREEQIAPLTALVAGVIEPHAAEPGTHPLASVSNRVDADLIARQLDVIATCCKDRTLGLAAVARFREQLGSLADSAAWLSDEPSRRYLTNRIGELLKRLD